MTLSPQHQELVNLVQELSPEQVLRVLNFAQTVKTQPPIDYSDEWTEEDLRELSNEVLRRLDEVDPYDWPEDEQRVNGAPHHPSHQENPEGGPGLTTQAEGQK